MSYISCDMDCDKEINKSDIEEHCSDCLCVGGLMDEEQQNVSAMKAWRSTSVVEERGLPKTLSRVIYGIKITSSRPNMLIEVRAEWAEWIYLSYMARKSQVQDQT